MDSLDVGHSSERQNMRLIRFKDHGLPSLLRGCLAIVLCTICAAEQAHASDRDPRVARTNNRSPTFAVPPGHVNYFMNYTGYVYTNAARTEGTRTFHDEISSKALEMIDAAEHTIILSVFLFDNFYAEAVKTPDVVGMLTDALVGKLATHPGIRISVILDPSHKAYGKRVSPAERKFRDSGIDVFYSDLVSGLKKASLTGFREGAAHINRGIDTLTFNGWTTLWSGLFSRAKTPAEFDGDPVTLEAAYNAFLLKSNHRKLLITDVRGSDYEAMITSANPHNASAYHVNSAISVKGNPARYLYNVLREDMQHSAKLGRNYSHWNTHADRSYRKSFFQERFASLPYEEAHTDFQSDPVKVICVTESEIADAVVDMLDRTQSDDEVRIQMFYLSFRPVLDAILRAANKTSRPVRLLLDTNKDSFNKVKDGTPNRQVARYLLNQAPDHNIEVRWYSTHGEQNHAKILSISNPGTGKYELTTGSCNWTGRNMDGVNMEANVVVIGSRDATEKFNELFDRFWTNQDGTEYSLDYEAYQDAAPDWKWTKGEKPYYWSTF